MKRYLQTLLLAASALMGVSHASSAAELGMRHFGARGGVSTNPDQFQGGIFLEAGRISFIRIQPSFELGIGNGVRLGAANLDAVYPFSGASWRPYAGGGLGVNFIDVTDGVGEGRGLSVEPVLNVVGGVQRHSEGESRIYVIEARLGFGDTPDFKVMAGMTFW